MVDAIATLARAVRLYLDRAGDNPLGGPRPAEELLPELTTIVEGDFGLDSTQMAWAEDADALARELSDPTVRAAFDAEGVVVSVGRPRNVPYVTFHVISKA